MFGSSLLPVVCRTGGGGLVSYLRYLFLLTHSGVQHILCCVFALFFLGFFLYHMLAVSLDCRYSLTFISLYLTVLLK